MRSRIRPPCFSYISGFFKIIIKCVQRPMGTFFRQWLRGKEGVTAVEFSMVGVPFVLMTIGIIELALMFTAQSLLHESTFTAARLIRTGQVQQAGGNEEMFREAICNFAAVMIPCNRIQFQVREMPDFASAGEEELELDEEGNLTDTPFDPGGASSVVLIRVVYNYRLRTPLMGSFFANRADNRRTMMSTMVLQTEPYE